MAVCTQPARRLPGGARPPLEHGQSPPLWPGPLSGMSSSWLLGAVWTQGPHHVPGQEET